MQAAIVACHARARTAAETDWEKIVALYDALYELTRSPVVALNRAVAVGMAFGPAAGLRGLDALAAEPALRHYHLLPSARGELLEQLGRGGSLAHHRRSDTQLDVVVSSSPKSAALGPAP